MNFKKILILVTIIIVLSSTIILLISSISNNPKQNQITTDNVDSSIIGETDLKDSFETNELETFEFTLSGWIPYWGSTSGLNSLKNNPDLFSSISPVWFEVNKDGSLKTKFPSNKKEMIDFLNEKNIDVIPAIAMFDHELFTEVLQNPDNLGRHIKSIVDVVVNNNFDGIDLDYESTKLSDKEKYFEFLSRLNKDLKLKDKKLIVTVIAKWGDDITYPSLVETREVQDWSEIQNYADKIRIMAYDYTFIKSKFPGPIGPLNWIEEVIKYGVSKVDPQKLVLGVHLYAYEWIGQNESKLPFVPNMKMNSAGDSEAKAFTYTEVKNILKSNNGKSSNYEGEKIFDYVAKDNISRSLVYIDPKGINDRINLAKEYNLAGVVFWRIGGDFDLLSNLDTLD